MEWSQVERKQFLVSFFQKVMNALKTTEIVERNHRASENIHHLI